jgi:L-aminopeptidase/D-esterase-like protein
MRFPALVVGLAFAATEIHAQNPAGSPSQQRLEPRTRIAGPVLEFEFPGLEIGVAEYDEGPTGATIFYFPKGVMAVVDVRGGAPATINTDALRLAYPSAFVDAISIAGGSSYGLSAATGAADAIKEERANSGDWGNIATVAGAIIFDLGGRRFNTVTPDYELGRAAFRARVKNRFPLTNHGAGRFTTQGGYFADSLRQHSGQGGAFRQVGPTKIAVFTVVNSLGTVVDRSGRIARCGRATATGCGTIADRISGKVRGISEGPAGKRAPAGTAPTDNTTITLVVTNEKLPYWALQRLAVQVHASLARSIQPYSTENDGDVLFAVTTGEVDNTSLSAVDLGLIASEVAWDAVLSSLPELPRAAASPAPQSAASLDAFVGTYSLSPNARFVVSRSGNRLLIQAPESGGIYLRKAEPRALLPISASEFMIDNARGDRLRFDRDDRGAVVGFTINPEGWPVRARR